MSRRILMCGTAALACGAVLAAQTAQPPRVEKPAAGVVAAVTLTGCLQRVPADLATGGSDERPAVPAGVTHILTMADGVAIPAPETGAGGAPTVERDRRFLLLAGPTMPLAPHENHTVKVVGTITPQPAPGATTEEKIAEPSRAETNLPAGPTPEAYRLNLVEVASVTMVSRSCDGK